MNIGLMENISALLVLMLYAPKLRFALLACQLVSGSSCRTIELSHWVNVSPSGQVYAGVYESYIYRYRRNPLSARARSAAHSLLVLARAAVCQE